jgi:hypothetical protein
MPEFAEKKRLIIFCLIVASITAAAVSVSFYKVCSYLHTEVVYAINPERSIAAPPGVAPEVAVGQESSIPSKTQKVMTLVL